MFSEFRDQLFATNGCVLIWKNAAMAEIKRYVFY